MSQSESLINSNSVEKLHELNLQSRIKYLEDELAQCHSDKEFVWSLWRQLQLQQPDLTNAISAVVQREKEKAEQKDKKILKILEQKDEKLKQLEMSLLNKQGEIGSLKEELTKMDMKLNTMRDEENLVRFQLKQLEDENQFYSKLIQTQKDETIRLSMTNDSEKMQLLNKINDLNNQIDRLRQTEMNAQLDLKENKMQCTMLNSQIKMANENYDKLFSDLTKLNTNMDHIKYENKKLHDENVLMNDKNSKLRAELDQLLIKFNSNLDYITQINHANERFKFDLDQCLKQIQTLNLKLNEKELACEELKKKLIEYEFAIRNEKEKQAAFFVKSSRVSHDDVDYKDNDVQPIKLRSKSCDNRNKRKTSCLLAKDGLNEYHSDNEEYCFCANSSVDRNVENDEKPSENKIKLFYESLFKEKDAQLKLLRDAYDSRLDRLTYLEKQNKMLKEEAQQRKEETNLIACELEILHKENKKMMEESFKFKKILSNNTNKKKNQPKKKSTNKKQLIIKQLNKKLDEMKEKVTSMEQAEKMLREKLSQLTKQKMSLEFKLKQFKQINETNERKLSQIQKSKQSEQTQIKQEKLNDTKFKQLNSDICKQNEKIKLLKSELDSALSKLKQTDEKLNHAERDLTQKKSLLEQYKKKCEEQTESNESIEKLKDLNQKYSQEISNLRSKLNKDEQKCEQLKKENQQLTVNLTKMKTNVKEMNATMNKLEHTAQSKMKSLSELSEQTMRECKARMDLVAKSNQNLKLLFEHLYSEILCRKFENLNKEKLKISAKQTNEDEKMKKAIDLASSILNLTTDELDNLMIENNGTSKEITNKENENVSYLKLLLNEFENSTELTNKQKISNLIEKKLNQILNLQSELENLKTANI